jgi:DNA repair exonuclease SbcCD ATPase subunit
MHQEATPQAMGVSLKQHAELPHILRQSNYLGAPDMRTANVNFRVKPHTDSSAVPIPVQRQLHELYPTQSTSRQAPHAGEHDWSKHEIVASVAGLHSKLEQLDSEIRSGASAETAGASVLRQVQDHANLLRENARQLQATQSKHKEVTALSHKILSQMNDNTQQHATSLQACEADIAKLKSKNSTVVGLAHDICSELHSNLLETTNEQQGMMRDIALLQQKDVVAQALLGKMLTMLDQHESVVTNGLANGDKMSQKDLKLLDGMCDAFEKSKQKMLSLERTQQEMHQVIKDFQAARLPAASAHDGEALQTQLDRYLRLYKDIDGQCTLALQQHGAKIDDLQRSHQQALHEQRMKVQQLEHAHQQALDEHQGKLQMLERKFAASQGDQRKIAELESKVQALALEQFNNSNQASIAKGIERKVESLQHELRSFHSLNSSVSTVQADLQLMREDNSARNKHTIDLKKEVDSFKSTLHGIAQAQQSRADELDQIHRDMKLQSMRIDKASSSVQDIHSKLAA